MSRRILVADDEPDIREIVRTVLELAGYEVLLASDGQQALEIARQQSPDVILLDVMMPRLDGREVARRIRRNDTGDDTTIILFSALDEADVEWQEVGADAFHTKKELVHIGDFIEDVIAS